MRERDQQAANPDIDTIVSRATRPNTRAYLRILRNLPVKEGVVSEIIVGEIIFDLALHLSDDKKYHSGTDTVSNRLQFT